VEDLGSTNGTYVNSKRLTSPVSLRRGDRVQVGRTVLELTR
jgi:pSer/pThr/pTyr-binding forkhead associated (FHA) protein